MSEARLVGTERSRLSPWVTLVTRRVERPGMREETWHSLEQSDYVGVLALTADGRVPLVRQFRPAVRRVTLELPGGLLDSSDPPEAVAARELEEECGLRASGAPVLLGRLLPDTGRLENGLWCYFAPAEPLPGRRPEAGIECRFVAPGELRRLILDGEFDHALHIALVGLAVMRGHFSWGA